MTPNPHFPLPPSRSRRPRLALLLAVLGLVVATAIGSQGVGPVAFLQASHGDGSPAVAAQEVTNAQVRAAGRTGLNNNPCPSGTVHLKFDGSRAAAGATSSQTATVNGSSVTVTGSVGSDGKTVSFSITSPGGAAVVYVKGGTNANEYEYKAGSGIAPAPSNAPGAQAHDDGLRSPGTAAVSHFSFCLVKLSATVKVVKEAEPEDGTDFEFAGTGSGIDASFKLDDGGAADAVPHDKTFTISSFGTKTIKETAPTGWSIANIDCTGAGTGGFTKTSDTATIVVDPGENVVCTFTNKKDATVKVVKEAEPEDGTDFDFAGSGGGIDASFKLDDGGAADAVPHDKTFTIGPAEGYNDKTISETAPTGWGIADIDCTGAGTGEFSETASSATVGVDPGETIVCTFTNKQDATVKVVKEAEPEDGTDFDFTGSGGGIDPSFKLDDGGAADATPHELTFTIDSADGFDDKTISESPPSGWGVADIDCTGAGTGEFSETPTSATVGVDPGETIVCTFTNRQAATLKVVKEAEPEDGTDFDFDGAGGGVDADFDLDDGGPVDATPHERTFTIDAAAGFDDKTIAENVPTGWGIADIDCTGAGTGEFSETANSATVGVDPGETIVCTFTNKQEATVKVVKEAEPEDGTDFDFDGTGGGIDADFDLDDGGPADATPSERTFTIDVAAGFDDKTIAENPPTGWAVADIDCTGAGTGEFSETANSATVGVDPGETIVCTFTNRQQATVKVVKEASPEDGTDFNFTGSGGGIDPSFKLDDGGTADAVPHEVTFTIDSADGFDDKTITETPTSGWSLMLIDCTGAGTGEFTKTSTSATVGVDPGEAIVCTFSNKKDVQPTGCTIRGTDGDDILIGTPGPDWICGHGGNDKIFGGGNSDTLVGHEGNDELYGEDGHDTLIAGPGSDLLDGGDGADRLEGGTGNDTLLGRLGNDNLFGQENDDLLRGGDGNDGLTGGPNFDTCFQDAGTGSRSTCEAGS